MTRTLEFQTRKRIQMVEITRELQELVQERGLGGGICTVFCPHTTAGLAINENADPDVCDDLERAFEAVVPQVTFRHSEGNSPAHFLSCITGSSLHILVENGRLQLGRWQGVFFCEFDGPRRRNVWVTFLPGE